MAQGSSGNEGAKQSRDRNVNTSFEQAVEFIAQEEPLRTVQALLAHARTLPDAAAIAAMLVRATGYINERYARGAPEEWLPKGMKLDQADALRMMLLESYDDAAVGVDASAEEAAFRLRAVLTEIVRKARASEVTKDQILETLAGVQKWYEKHVPKASKIIDTNKTEGP